MNKSFKIAAVQLEYTFLDLERGCDKAVSVIAEAASQGADLIGFPELYLPGFPFYIMMGPVGYTSSFFPKYYDSSIVLGDQYTQRLQSAAKQYDINVVMGYSQRKGHSLYMSQMFIDRTGQLVGNRSKLKPTHAERTVFGEGDGGDIFTVDLPGVGTTGALCCWEHLQPLLKYSMFSMGEEVHIASWPAFCTNDDMAYALGSEANMAASRTYALEGQCFTLASTGILTAEHLEAMQLPSEQPFLKPGGGTACVFGPDGRQITKSLPPQEEGIVYADANMDYLKMAKHFADPVGHYARPDVYRLLLNQQSSPKVEQMNEPMESMATPHPETEGEPLSIDTDPVAS